MLIISWFGSELNYSKIYLTSLSNPRSLWMLLLLKKKKKVFAGKIKDLEMKKSSSIIRWVQIQWQESLWDTRKIWQTERKAAILKGRQTLEWQDQKTKEDNAKRHEKQEEAFEGVSPDISERKEPCLHLDFGCLTSQTKRIILSQFVATVTVAMWKCYSLLTT